LLPDPVGPPARAGGRRHAEDERDQAADDRASGFGWVVELPRAPPFRAGEHPGHDACRQKTTANVVDQSRFEDDQEEEGAQRMPVLERVDEYEAEHDCRVSAETEERRPSSKGATCQGE